MKRIWEVKDFYYCPVAGFCLSTAEQQMILKKTVLTEDNRNNPAHELIINQISVQSPAARLTEKVLNRKYKKEISLYREVNGKEWTEQSDNLLTPEDFGALIWISAACIPLTEEENQHIYHKIHDYSHEIFFQLQKLSKELICVKNRYSSLNEKYKDIRQKKKRLEMEIKAKDSELQQISRKKTAPPAGMKDFTASPGRRLAEESKAASHQQIMEKQRQTIQALKAENGRMAAWLNNDMSYFNELKKDFHAFLSLMDKKKCDDCGEVSLCRRRVLIVGGILKMQSFYKEMVHKMGGEFSYHDGHCHSRQKGLSYLIQQSDIVICPVDVNSHAACLHVKKTCKKSGKDFFMLKKSSISTLYHTLVEAAGS